MTKEEILKGYTGKKMTPGKAMRAFCVDCCGGSPGVVKLCLSTDCYLYPYRLGVNPYLSRFLSDDRRMGLKNMMALLHARKAAES